MKLLGNIIWFIFGGLEMAIVWFLFGLLATVTIIGIPWARSCFVIAKFTLWPFGRVAVKRSDLNNKEDIGTGGLGLIGNVVWIIFAGIWLALGHILAAMLTFLTIIGIPFAIQHFKLAGLAFAPIGKVIVTNDEAKPAKL
jgi:uncharacterized membrane protein YccF (DUF307 family)